MPLTAHVKKQKFRSLTATLTAAFFLSTFSVLLLFTALVFYFSVQTQREVLLSQEELVAQDAANMVKNFVEDKFRVLDQAADVNDLATTHERRGLVFNNLLGRVSSFRQLFLIDNDGKELQKISRLSSLAPDPIGDLKDPLLAATLRGDNYISPIYIDPVTSEPLVLLAIPSRDSFREPVGAFVAEVNLKFIWDLVDSIKVGQTGYAYVVDKKGELVAFADTSRVLQHEQLSSLREVGEFLGGTEVDTGHVTPTVGILGTSVVSIHVPLTTPDWVVVTELPIREAYQPLLIQFIFLFIITLLLSVLAIVTARTLSKRLTGPLVHLRDIVSQMREGDLGVRFNVDSHDEIGTLGEAFNETVTYLQKLTTNLEAEVLERTEDLQKFKLAIENTSQHIIITDPDGIILYANPAVTEVTGYTHAEIVGSTPSLWGQQMPKEFYTKMWQTIKTERHTFTGEIQNKRKNGEYYVAFTTISPVVNTQGELRFFVGLESDVSAQKKLELALKEQVIETEKSKAAVLNLLEDIEAEKEKVDDIVIVRTQELSEEKARLVSSINSIPFGFLIANNDGRVLLMNEVLMSLFHLDDREVLTLSDVAERLGATSDLESEVAECMKGQVVCEMKEIILGAKVLRGIIAPIITGGGGTKTIGYVLLFEDVTEAKVLERSRDEFFSIASHELRTPLTAIRGNSEMINTLYKDKIVDRDMADMLSDIHEASVRLIDIVNDFLDVARLEQGNVVVEKTPFDVAEPIERVFRDLRLSLEKKGLAFSFKKPQGLPLVLGDKVRLEQVVMNLLGNAIKFSTKGLVGVEILIELEKNHLKILVSDTGMGMSPENQMLLFHKFQQAGEKILARDVTQGTGLGLYISKLLIERMGGTMGLVKSAPGEGSTFYFTLPLA